MNQPTVYNFDNPIDFINSYITYLRSIDSTFSLNRFAKEVCIPITKLREVMKRKRKLKIEILFSIQKGIDIDPSEFFYLQVLTKKEYANKKDCIIYEQLINQLKPNSDDFSCHYNNKPGLYSHWISMAILSLSDAQVNLNDIDYIRSTLTFEVSRDEVKKSLKLLTDIGVLTIFDDGTSVVNFDRVTTKSDQKDIETSRYYKSVNSLSNSAIRLPLDLREYQLFTTNISIDQIPLLKNILRETRNRISRLSKSGSGEAVYQLNLQAFPLTHKLKRNEGPVADPAA